MTTPALLDVNPHDLQLAGEEMDGWGTRLPIRRGGFELPLARGLQVIGLAQRDRPVCGDRGQVRTSLMGTFAPGPGGSAGLAGGLLVEL